MGGVSPGGVNPCEVKTGPVFGWALSCFNAVNDEPPRSLATRLDLVRAAGCAGYQVDVPLDWPVSDLHAAADAAGLRCLVVNDYQQDLARFSDHLSTAAALGARWYNHHLPKALENDLAHAAEVVRELRQRCADVGVAYCIETHRATLTQSLERTYELLGRVPGLRLWGDLSHYIIRGESYAQLRDLYPHLDGLHLRAANTDHVQPEIVPGRTLGLDEFGAELTRIGRSGFAGGVVVEGISWYMSFPRYDLHASNRRLLDLARGWLSR